MNIHALVLRAMVCVVTVCPLLGSRASAAEETRATASTTSRFSDATAEYVALMRVHYDHVIASGVDAYGDDKSGIWLASVDINAGGQPTNPDPAVKRTYRQTHAPRGSNLPTCGNRSSRRITIP